MLISNHHAEPKKGTGGTSLAPLPADSVERQHPSSAGPPPRVASRLPPHGSAAVDPGSHRLGRRWRYQLGIIRRWSLQEHTIPHPGGTCAQDEAIAKQTANLGFLSPSQPRTPRPSCCPGAIPPHSPSRASSGQQSPQSSVTGNVGIPPSKLDHCHAAVSQASDVRPAPASR